jgi:hypothetical protein
MKYCIAILFASAVWGQQLDLSRLDALSSKARESANVSLDAEKLKIVAGFAESKDKETQELLSNLKGLYVRAFEFDNPGAYSQSELDGIRAQLRGPNWARIVEVKEKDESAEIWFYSEGGKPGGMAVLVAEPNELVVVNLVGPVDFKALGKLGGVMGIPNVRTGVLDPKRSPATSKPAAPAKKDE